jgi:hypothetical protein
MLLDLPDGHDPRYLVRPEAIKWKKGEEEKGITSEVGGRNVMEFLHERTPSLTDLRYTLEIET